MKTLTTLSAALCLVATGCASNQPSRQLADARRAYGEVQASEANTYAPAQVVTAKQALQRAEQAHDDDAGSYTEQSLAYVALRQAAIASAWSDTVKAQRDHELADENYKKRQEQLRTTAEQQLETTREKLEMQDVQFERERQARMEAEKRAAAAVQSLREIAEVREEARGTVITLGGEVLFASGKSQLLGAARERLARVAAALKGSSTGQVIVVEGHTDSRGSDETNMKLSQARADAVREYLTSQGVSAELIRAEGRGEQQPIATNDTPEGRANNRRVEIVIQKARMTPAQPRRGTGAATPGANPPSAPTR